MALALWVMVLLGEALAGSGRLDLVRIAAALVTSWIAISVATRLIHNRALAHAVAYVLWAIVALRITGLHPSTICIVDALGFTVGEARVSLLRFIKTALILSALVWIAVEIGNSTSRRLEATADLTPGLRVLLGKLVRIVLVALAFLVALNAVGIDLTALAFFSGAPGVGIGFGLQKVVSNFVSGIIILMDKSIKPGDAISLGETYGWIRSLHSRFVLVKTRNGGNT